MPYHTRHRSNTDQSVKCPSNSSAVPHLKFKNPHPCRFPPAGLRLHPEDEASKVFFAIGKALASVNNCAMTVKDLAESALRNGLHCTGSAPLNAASQQITSFIRSHQKRCEQERSKPLIKSFILTGTSDDDKFTPALYSRAGGTATRRSTAVDTAFRKGTQVWYLSSEAGLEDPFERVGIRLPGCRKRQRISKKDDGGGDSEEETRPKIKLKIRLGPLATSMPRAVSSTVPRSPLPHTPGDEDVILLDSPPSSPTSSCSLSLPPYPIESHCRYLHDIPLSPFEVPEYASPPPDSEDDDHDFHTSMMVGADDSFDESVSLKYEADSDGEGADGRRSRSASWTTTTDPKTPKEGERPLSYPTVRIEGHSMWRPDTDVKDILDEWDATSISRPTSEEEEDMKEEELIHDGWQRHWMSTEDVIDLMGLMTPHDVKVEQEEDEEEGEHIDIEGMDTPDDIAILGLRTLRLNSKRSSSIPLFGTSSYQSSYFSHDFSSLPPSPILVPVDDADDDIEILGPDSVTVQELDQERLWQAGKSSPRRSHSRVSTSILDPTTVRTRSYDSVPVDELIVNAHTLRRRVDNSLVHLPSLLTVLAHRAPASKFMHLEGAMHVKSGDLQGTWVPLAFAKSLAKGKASTPKEVVQFLQDESPVKRLHSIPAMKLPPPLPNTTSTRKDPLEATAALTSPAPPLLPPISLPITSVQPLPQLTTFVPQPKFLKRDSYEFKFTDKPMWQRDGFTDWKVNADSEFAAAVSTSAASPFSFLAPMRATVATQATARDSDCPLSPQEEEIFLALVDIRDPNAKSAPVEPEIEMIHPTRSTRVQRPDEDADDEEGDDESEVKTSRPRRSQRVAAKVGSARISVQAGSKRPSRLRK